MHPLHPSEEERTLLIGRSAEGDDIIETLVGELIKCLGILVRDVDSQLCQDLDGYGIDPGCFRPGGIRLKTITKVFIYKTFCHLGST